MDLSRQIESAEKKYKQILEGFFISVYKENYLPSHGLSHHRRVWNIAKELTRVLDKHNFFLDPRFPDSLIIACYLHDIGMAVEPGPDHGRHSAELTRRFLSKYSLPESEFPGLLEAVLRHDQKDYSSPSAINLHSVLSIADDLDAFGYTGIYRYTEIYSLREVKFLDIGGKIRQNAANRYRHFEELMSFDEELVRKHAKRHEILDIFFRNVENDIMQKNSESGYMKVVDVITSTAKSGTAPEEMISEHENDVDPVVRKFFSMLKTELNIK